LFGGFAAPDRLRVQRKFQRFAWTALVRSDAEKMNLGADGKVGEF